MSYGSSLSGLMPTNCPVCGYTVGSLFFNGGYQTLATLGWPPTAQDAMTMPKHALDFVQCLSCSHVWNRSFHYDAIPYQKNPNRMFNKGGTWQAHLMLTRDTVLKYLPETPTVVEIGCGEGHFVRGIAQARNEKGRFVGFDPNTNPETGRGVEFVAEYFNPLVHMPDYKPHAVVIRHVLEHLTDPASLLEQLAWGASALSHPSWLFVEVPCIDRVFSTERLADFFYEHMSHFTTESFRTLMSRAGHISELSHGYDGEVVFALVRLGVSRERQDRADCASAFYRKADSHRAAIRERLDELSAQGKRVAIWGGSGKAAAFIHQFGADAKRFPLVVDSDQDKAGTFVPGAGQQIVFRDVLKKDPPDVVIIPTQWRAKDIVLEMQSEGIKVQQILIEHKGHLIDFLKDQHPYSL